MKFVLSQVALVAALSTAALAAPTPGGCWYNGSWYDNCPSKSSSTSSTSTKCTKTTKTTMTTSTKYSKSTSATYTSTKKSSTATASASATPSSTGPNDFQILNYALTLEHLEDKFYRDGLAKYSQADFAAAGFSATFYNNLKEVSYDETTHVSFLTGAIQAAGGTPVAECTYSFPYTDPKSFVAVASVLEGVGVSAYLGAAAFIMNKNYLTAAGSILTVESRHSAYIRAGLGESPFPQPFDAPLDFNEVYTLAAPFIVSCPASNPPLPVMAFPALTLTTTGTIKDGSTITLKSAKNLTGAGKLYAAFVTVTGPIFQPVTVSGDGMSVTTTVPTGIEGQSYAILVNSATMATDDTTVAGPAIIEVSM